MKKEIKQRVIKFRVIYQDKVNGYERLTQKHSQIFWEWMALDLNPENGFERWSLGVYPSNYKLIRNQFTGLLDKSGKEIYEGDIVVHDGEHYEINYKAPSFGIDAWNVKTRDYTDRILSSTRWEIIGNIYEHPNLISQPCQIKE